MSLGRKLKSKPRTRPTKSGADRRRREKVQKRRLVSLGVDAAVVEKLPPEDVRIMLRRPAWIKKAVKA
jgi:hypothetical protein